MSRVQFGLVVGLVSFLGAESSLRAYTPSSSTQSLLDQNPGFAPIAEWLTDGISTGNGLFQEIRVLGLLGSEEIIGVHVDRISEFDLFGYRVERIDRHVTFSIRSPGGNADAMGTEFRMGGVYEFWGSPVPEPATLWACAIAFAFGVARHSGHRLMRIQTTWMEA